MLTLVATICCCLFRSLTKRKYHSTVTNRTSLGSSLAPSHSRANAGCSAHRAVSPAAPRRHPAPVRNENNPERHTPAHDPTKVVERWTSVNRLLAQLL